MSLASEIRNQLRAKPNRKTFRKHRDKLLEIAVSLEALHGALSDLDSENQALRALIANEGINPNPKEGS